jgi:hypothetical protein
LLFFEHLAVNGQKRAAMERQSCAFAGMQYCVHFSYFRPSCNTKNARIGRRGAVSGGKIYLLFVQGIV